MKRILGKYEAAGTKWICVVMDLRDVGVEDAKIKLNRREFIHMRIFTHDTGFKMLAKIVVAGSNNFIE